MGTIDQQVDDKKNMMRSNPGMQGTVGKDLIGVMALQKMQKEKQAAENELMLAQQNNPSTIKEQLENEVAGLTQNEMATQTAGIMNQRQQQQGKQQRPQQQQRPQGIQQVASRPPMGGAPRPPMPQGAPRPPMGGAPRPPMGGAGIAGAPRPPMMAQGGIVGFYDGGKVSEEKLKELGMTRAQYDALPEATKKMLTPKQPPKLGKTREERTDERLQGQKDIKAGQQAFNQRLADNKKKQAMATAEAAGLQIADPITASPAERTDTPLMGKPKEAGLDFSFDPNTAGIAGAVPKADPKALMGGDKPPMAPSAGPQGELAGMLKGKLNTAPTAEQLSTIGAEQASSRLDSGAKTTLDTMSKGADPAEAMKTAQAAGDERYNKNYDSAGIKAKRDAVDAEMLRQLSPEAQKEQRLRAGAVQRGGLAGARARAGNRADERRYKMFNDSANNYAADMKADVDKLKAVDTTAAKIMEQISADRRAALGVFGDLAAADQAAVSADKDRFQKQNQAAVDALLAGMKIESEEKLMQSIQNSKDSTALTSYWEALRETRSEAIDKYLTSNEYLMLDPAEQKKARAKRVISITKRFENLEKFIIKSLEAKTPGLDLSSFVDSATGDSQNTGDSQIDSLVKKYAD